MIWAFLGGFTVGALAVSGFAAIRYNVIRSAAFHLLQEVAQRKGRASVHTAAYLAKVLRIE